MKDVSGTTILAIEDDAFLRANICSFLGDSGFRVIEAPNGRMGLYHYHKEKPDLVLLDLRMPEVDGLTVLKEIREVSEETPVIVISGMGVLGDVVESLRLGAWDYLMKPIEDMEILGHAARSALDKARLQRENREYQEQLELLVEARTTELETANRELEDLRGQLELENEYLREEIFAVGSTDSFVGRSPALGRILKEIKNVAPTDANVLISGESGAGKELVARTIHEQSRRRGRPLIKVNCASVPKDLFESEFFGHVKGSFTGAVRDRVGRFRLADQGTLFLDEIGEIPMELQGKLLRVLQEGEFERVGEDTTHRVDVRVLAASNRRLEEEIRAGRFREDLYYRLNVYPILVPPLRERIDDIAPLASHFLAQASRKLGIPEQRLKQRHVLALETYQWPGNVRELQNVIERAAITSRGGPLHIDLPAPDAQSGCEPAIEGKGVLPPGWPDSEVLTEAEMRRRERENILAALRRVGWKVSGPGGAAKILGVKPTTLSSRMKVMGIEKPH